MEHGYWLRVRLPDGRTQSYAVPESGLCLGRAQGNDVVLADSKVSGRHARLQIVGRAVELVDVGSSNGTYVDGRRVPSHSAHRLRPGCTIRLGDTTVHVEPGPSPEEAQPGRHLRRPPATNEGAALVLQTQVGDRTDEMPVLKGELSIGRAADNDIVLENPKVSSHHARLYFRSTGLGVMDLGSLNGTRLNGQPLASRQGTSFNVGDCIQIAEHSFAIRPTTQEAPAPPPIASQVRLSPTGPAGLVIHEGGRQTRHALEKPLTSIGRSSQNEVVISASTVSGSHARIQRADGALWILDLDSQNGLFFEGKRVSRKALKDGDVVYLGRDVALEFREHIGFQPTVPRPTLPPAQTLRLTSDTVTIGRAHDNTMVIDHPQVSRYHALVERLGMRTRVKDLKSSNGIFVNGKRIDGEAWVERGDEIRIGPYRLRVGENILERMSEEGLRIDALRLQKWVTPKLNLLQEISLSIHPQEFVALVGLSGAGKSTLMDALNGFRPATHGAVFVNGVNLYQKFDMFRNDMGYVPQQDIVHTQLTVYQALSYAAELRMPADTTAGERHRRVLEVIEELDLSERKNVPIRKLSGGQLKRVSIGVELLTKPRLFFLDEPTSGLDPGTEYNMMRLLRKLADQGRTIMLITHATKNVMMCDKVIIIIRGGYLAYYGPPEQALSYFDQFRSDHERRIKDIEFDDIYTILEDAERGAPEEWAERYKRSPQYKESVVRRLKERDVPAASAQAKTGVAAADLRRRAAKGVSAPRQFSILSRRNLRIMASDRATLGLMLALAPLLSVMETAGRGLFDPINGKPSDIIMTLFLNGLISYLVGALTSVREIVKEIDIYKRERAINLKITPYVMSKVWVGFVLALYTGAVFVVVRQGLMTGLWPGTLIGHGKLGWGGFAAFFITFALSSLSGYLMGLFISAVSPNQNMAILLIIVALVPQFLLAGGMMPLDMLGTGGEIISSGVSNRWAFEAGVNITGFGKPVVEDPCWDNLPKIGEDGQMGWNDYLNLSNEEKAAAGCACMGSAIFTGPCSRFPGILNDDYYSEEAKQALARPEPVQPEQPTPYPSPTPYPTPTPLPTPSNPADFEAYMDDMRAQGDTYQDAQEEQGNTYQDIREAQGDEYEAAMEAYSDEFADWQQTREQAIGGAEGLLKSIFETYGRTFRGHYATRWVNLSMIIVVTMVLIVVSQKRKDAV